MSRTRYFIIQGSDTLDHWKVNLTFDPVVFEDPSLGVKVSIASMPCSPCVAMPAYIALQDLVLSIAAFDHLVRLNTVPHCCIPDMSDVAHLHDVAIAPRRSTAACMRQPSCCTSGTSPWWRSTWPPHPLPRWPSSATPWADPWAPCSCSCSCTGESSPSAPSAPPTPLARPPSSARLLGRAAPAPWPPAQRPRPCPQAGSTAAARAVSPAVAPKVSLPHASIIQDTLHRLQYPHHVPQVPDARLEQPRSLQQLHVSCRRLQRLQLRSRPAIRSWTGQRWQTGACWSVWGCQQELSGTSSCTATLCRGAFACDYKLVADLLARVNDGFREHGCLQNTEGRQVHPESNPC